MKLKDNTLVSGLIIPANIDVATRLSELAKGNSIIATKTGARVWLNNKSGKLNSDILSCISSLPSIVFNNDIKFAYDD